MDDQYKEKIDITTDDAHSFQLTVFGDLQNTTNPLIVCLPAMGVPGKHYHVLGQILSQAGCTALIADLRGLGSSSFRASGKINFGYWHLVAKDLTAIVGQLRKIYPDRKLFLLGHSLGGQLSVMYSALAPESINGVILVASGTVYYKNWSFPSNLKILFSTQLARLIALLLGYFPGRRIGFGGTEAKNIIRDWANMALFGNLTPMASPPDFENHFSKPQIPVLAISLEGDWYAPPKALQHLYQKLTNAQKTVFHLTEKDAPPETLHHFNWIKHPQPVIKKIVEWINHLE